LIVIESNQGQQAGYRGFAILRFGLLAGFPSEDMDRMSPSIFSAASRCILGNT
jgi:hypothetical protein